MAKVTDQQLEDLRNVAKVTHLHVDALIDQVSRGFGGEVDEKEVKSVVRHLVSDLRNITEQAKALFPAPKKAPAKTEKAPAKAPARQRKPRSTKRS